MSLIQTSFARIRLSRNDFAARPVGMLEVNA